MITALNLTPLAFTTLEKGPKATLENGRVKAVCEEATRLGIEVGMPASLVLIKAPPVQLAEHSNPTLKNRWHTLQLEFFRYSVNLESLAEGLCLVSLPEADARLIAKEHGAKVGRGPTRELAVLASTLAPSGEVHTSTGPEGIPVSSLALLGIKADTIKKLHFLGIHTLDGLQGWDRKQATHYFGEEFQIIKGVLFERRILVARFQPPREITAAFDYDQDACQPHEIQPVLILLAEALIKRLSGWQARKLVLTARTLAGELWALRTIKDPIRHPRTLAHLLSLALMDTGATPLGISRIHVALQDLYQLGERQTLFEQRPTPEQAVARVHERYPGKMFNYTTSNPYAQARDLNFRKKPR
ncbi:hypothetical protein [Deinococcus roseus]|uniref:UmuC domain-containing protein n=1 Tax=Deinococcus roseus TaxID=392414 RepID=A0ABQ2DI88_9DEIO|nr:hypothetical protein [Deinococcus roseus]GGJ59018.1 hypothetical protein GCM10008938_51330 [Deinococcus roseus]